MTISEAPEKLADKVMLVTGANTGLGLATSIALARTGATVVMLCRDAVKGQAARQQVIAQTGNDRIEQMSADLGDLDSIAIFSRAFHARFDRLDVLINNAGVILASREETRQGLEQVFGVNHIGHFLLTLLLSDLLVHTKAARVVIVSSGAHKVGRIHFDDVNLKDNFSVIRSYSQSKLANVLFCRELSLRLNADDVAVNCCHPGAVATSIAINRKTGFGQTVTRIMGRFFRSPEKGAETAIALALTDLGAKNDGAYFINGRKARMARRAHDDVSAGRLWQLSLELTKPWLANAPALPTLLLSQENHVARRT